MFPLQLDMDPKRKLQPKELLKRGQLWLRDYKRSCPHFTIRTIRKLLHGCPARPVDQVINSEQQTGLRFLF